MDGSSEPILSIRSTYDPHDPRHPRGQYSDIRTGDVACLSSAKQILTIVNVFTSSIWSHCGIFVRVLDTRRPLETLSLGTEGVLCFLEVNTDEERDLVSDRVIRGCRLVVFDSVKHKYSVIGYRPLRSSIRSTTEFGSRLREFMFKYCGHLYEPDEMVVIAPAFGFQLADERKDHIRLFCSEMLAMFFMQLTDMLENPRTSQRWIRPADCLPYHFTTENEHDNFLAIFEGGEHILAACPASSWALFNTVCIILIIVFILLAVLVVLFKVF